MRVSPSMVTVRWAPVAIIGMSVGVLTASSCGSSAAKTGKLSGHMYVYGGPAPRTYQALPGVVTAKSAGKSATMTVGKDGAFGFTLPPGDYRVTGTSPGITERCGTDHLVKVRLGVLVTANVVCSAI